MKPTTATIAAHGIAATVSALGAELQTLRTAGGGDLLWDGDPAVWRGRAPVLFPVIGLLAGGHYRYDGTDYAMPKHGFARHSLFDSVAQSDSSVTMRLAADAVTRAIYPFEFMLDVVFAVQDAELKLTAIIRNNGAVPMPASFGFHPALRWPLPFGAPRDEHRLRFAKPEPAPVRRIGTDGLLLPQPFSSPIFAQELPLRDELFEADALIFDRIASRAIDYGTAGGPQVRVDYADFPVLGVWTKPGAEFICIEPWHGLPDPAGFDGDLRDKPGIMIIEPGASRRLAMSITLIGAANG